MNINLDKLGELCYARDLRVVVRIFDCWQVSIVMDENGHVVYFQCRSRGVGTLCWAEYNEPLMIKSGLLNRSLSSEEIEDFKRRWNENRPLTFEISTPESNDVDWIKQKFGRSLRSRPMPSGLYVVDFQSHDSLSDLVFSRQVCFSQSEQCFYDDNGLPSIVNSCRIISITEVK